MATSLPRRGLRRIPLGIRVHLAEVRTGEGTLCLLVAIDRMPKFAFVDLHEEATRRIAGDFLGHLVAAVPSTIHKVLIYNGLHSTDLTGDCWTPEDIKEIWA